MTTIARMLRLPAKLLAVSLAMGTAQAVAQSEQPKGGANPAFVTVQPAGEWLVSNFRGQPVRNAGGETIGDVNDLLFDSNGRVSTVVVGVGGFLGLGEKSVAFPFGALAITVDKDGKRAITAPYSKEELKAAPEFRSTEKMPRMLADEFGSDPKKKDGDR